MHATWWPFLWLLSWHSLFDFNHCNSYEDRIPVKFIYGHLMVKCVIGTAIWLHRSGSLLSQTVDVAVITAPNLYPNQSWMAITGVPWHPRESDSKRSTHYFNLEYVFRECTFEVTAAFPSGQWVNVVWWYQKFFLLPLCVLSGPLTPLLCRIRWELPSRFHSLPSLRYASLACLPGRNQ